MLRAITFGAGKLSRKKSHGLHETCIRLCQVWYIASSDSLGLNVCIIDKYQYCILKTPLINSFFLV